MPRNPTILSPGLEAAFRAALSTTPPPDRLYRCTATYRRNDGSRVVLDDTVSAPNPENARRDFCAERDDDMESDGYHRIASNALEVEQEAL